MSKVKHLFVYGSLRSGFKNPAYTYISQYFNFICHAKAKGVLHDMGSYPVAVSTDDEKFVVGELYEIKQPEAFDFAIAQLDDYEGLNAEDDATGLYERKLCKVYVNGEVIADANVYWFCGNVTNKPVVHHGDVMEYFNLKNS